ARLQIDGRELVDVDGVRGGARLALIPRRVAAAGDGDLDARDVGEIEGRPRGAGGGGVEALQLAQVDVDDAPDRKVRHAAQQRPVHAAGGIAQFHLHVVMGVDVCTAQLEA